ncbi:hypothetical protein [Lacticaseibacillus paracasei]|jgi:hypothetical protein|uniref:Uncharacterized protein n=1 Tax=Lacticaseibacillus paracasei subsp. paracasei CNCM I-4270 TaxID=1256202 RepID=A0A8E0M8R6_LACPA|nr:hypothetical protein [Lacticaseibacillus paracasei]EPC51598.1 hypothetical protein Lpp77_11691 [Lacticaseibacillus paracasei subsp. paracasei CNCM I-4270]MDM7550831.1 hypothetical protein [Lacticaseibacillus paracasei]RDV40217.1 hypothetical protein DQM07_15165 [Lacticaseibacillus paracasei subsp. paracasei]RND67810.1 hypothetical protein FAM18126_00608 [Lacticaseibacillus paracasei]RNE40537.1 hypothetical protein FAM7821_00574 [Lacticaseibacillus paracasei]
MTDIRNTYKPNVLEAWIKETREAGNYVSTELVQLHDDPRLGNALVLGFRFAKTPRALADEDIAFSFTHKTTGPVFWRLVGVAEAYANDFNEELAFA